MNQLSFIHALNIRHPILMAPMFLVSNEAMIKAGMDSGIAATFPALNFRKEGALAALLARLQAYREETSAPGNFGVNLIVHKSSQSYHRDLQCCVDAKVPFYITSLGDPSEVIQAAHSYGAKVLCDVTNLKHAEKAAHAGCDGFVGVGAGAGGHAGPHPLHVLLPVLRNAFPDKWLVAAGGIAHGRQVAAMRILGADAVSIGTRFIASPEANVTDEYKSAIMAAGMDDIVLTERLSGVPCNVINTPQAQKLGYRQNWLERYLSQKPQTKKKVRRLMQTKAMHRIGNALLPQGYQYIYSAGQSVGMVKEVLPIAEIVRNLLEEYHAASKPED